MQKDLTSHTCCGSEVVSATASQLTSCEIQKSQARHVFQFDSLPCYLDFGLKLVTEAEDDVHGTQYGFLEGSVLEVPSTLLINHLNENMKTAFITEKYFNVIEKVGI